MEISIKVGNTELEFSHEDFLKKLGNGINPFENIIPNFDNYYKLYDNLPSSVLNYYKELGKTLAEYCDLSKPGTGKIPDRPDVFPVNGHDIFNYIARYGIASFQLQIIMKFDGRLDFDKLSKAVRLTVDAEPVLGCRFVEANPPYWKRKKNIDNVMFCTFLEADDGDEAAMKFIDSHLNMDKDPMIKVKLIRSKAYDILAIKLNHACADGVGIKQYVQLLADIYSSIDLQNDELIPTPTPSKRGRIDQDRLFESLGITDPDALLIPGSDLAIPTWAFPWKQGTSSNTHFIFSKITPKQLKKIKRYAKSSGATMNDLILTAYYRAALKLGQPVYGVPMGISLTVDLRRYLPDYTTEAVRNFSGAVNTWLSMVKDEAFSDTLSRVIYMMNEIKNGYPGLQSAIGLERLEKISFKEALDYYQATSKIGKNMQTCNPFYGNRCIPTLSNLGYISKSLIRFGDATATDAVVAPPVVSPPGILLETGTYNNIMTMCLGYYENTVLREDMETLLKNIVIELMEGCK